jgi:hypothetical protein
MPALVAPFLAKAAVAAPAVATTTAATGLTTAANTAALELAKQQAIQAGLKKAGMESVKQAGIQQAAQTTAQQAAQTATQKAVETAAQQGLDPSKLDYLRSSTASLNPTAPSQFLPSKAPAGDLMSQIDKLGPANFADDIAASQSGIAQGAGSSYTLPGSTPIPSYATPAAPLPPAGGPMPPFKPVGNAPSAPELTENFFPKKPPFDPNLSAERASQIKAKYPQLSDVSGQGLGDPGTLSRIASDKGISDLTMRPASESMFKPTFDNPFPLAPKSKIAEGFETALEYVKDNPLEAGMLAMTAGQYMNKPEQEDKDKYKSTVDMSEFKASTPEVAPFRPSYEYQKYAAEGGLMGYAVGGPVETMAAQNAVGSNMAYPQAGLQTPVYSNPAVQRPEPVNVISPSGDAGVATYSGEPKFNKGGDISDEMAREYGLKSRKQRATKSLTQSYEEAQTERDKEAAALFRERSNPGIIRRSRTQEFSSPFSAAIEEHNRLAKKTKTQQFQQPKTSLGDIDNYMDIPVEAASGGIMGNLGGYSDGGRLLRGPGDGVSDSIPAVIGKRQPARLADGEFVIPARIVSELGNGSTEAGARKLYAMMERIQSTRKKSIGKKKVAVNSRADKHLPA